MEASVLVAQLAEAGITADPITVVKNGVTCMGLRVVDPGSPSITPIIYYSQDETVDAICSRVMAMSKTDVPAIDTDLLKSPEYISRNVYMTVQRHSNDWDGTVKKDLQNLELVLRLSVDLGTQSGSVKVNRVLLEQADISEDAIWMMARHNMDGQFRVFKLFEILDFPEEFTPDVPFYVCSTEDRTNGAVALAFPEVFKEFCQEQGIGSCLILPSSTEELILIPEGLDSFAVPELAVMVNDINNEVVDELVQLDPVVYKYDLENDEVTIAATFVEGGAA